MKYCKNYYCNNIVEKPRSPFCSDKCFQSHKKQLRDVHEKIEIIRLYKKEQMSLRLFNDDERWSIIGASSGNDALREATELLSNRAIKFKEWDKTSCNYDHRYTI